MPDEIYELPEDIFKVGDCILKQLQQKELNEEERKTLDEWIVRSEANQRLFNQLINGEVNLQSELGKYYHAEEEENTIAHKITEQLFPGPTVKPLDTRARIIKWARIAAAAIIILLVSSGTYFLLRGGRKQDIAKVKNPNTVFKNDVLPGGDKAVLTLANGTKIFLNDVQSGTLAQQGNTKVVKLDNGRLAYNGGKPNPKEILYNTVSTPRGGQYHVILPDGSHVWLNAASSVHFPTSFIGKERKVAITGEAYFEVSKDKTKPFRVIIAPTSAGEGRGEVEVLGTHFNVNSYDDESDTKVTLLEGSVKVAPPSTIGEQVVLKPGEQAAISHESQKSPIIPVQTADTEAAIAWKSGIFHFDNANIKNVMRQLSRWYDVDIVYQGAITTQVFGGDMDRNIPLSNILRNLAKTGNIHFEIQGKKVIVLP